MLLCALLCAPAPGCVYNPLLAHLCTGAGHAAFDAASLRPHELPLALQHTHDTQCSERSMIGSE
jgi:hypothetical protein